jgi:multiple sugar transport system permease protein
MRNWNEFARERPVSVRGRLGRSEERAAYLFLIPWVVGLLCFLIIPLIWSIWVSLSDERLLMPGKFIGLRNYTEMFTEDPLFYQALWVTVKWVILTTPFYLAAGLLLSLLLNQRLPGMNLFRTILYIPAVLSGVAVAILWINLFNPDLGAINYFLFQIGVERPPYWLQSPTWAMPAMVIIGLWGIGGGAVIYLAGLQNIPPHLYEAAALDGAGSWTKFRYITLPMLSPTIFFLLITGVIGAFQQFGIPFVLSGGSSLGGPANSLLFYMVYLYNVGFVRGLMGYASALAWVLTLIGVLAVYILFRFERRYVFYEQQ